MGYLQEFQNQVNQRNFSKASQLWEEYCANDTVDAVEFIRILELIKQSPLTEAFGKIAETALPLWQKIEEPNQSYKVIKLLIDIQTTNSPNLAETAFLVLKNVFEDDSLFNDRTRYVGLRSRTDFQGAISNYELLAHMDKGKYVFHTGGWGVGEIVDMSRLREQVTIEFENVSGRKHFSFANAFKTLVPLRNDSFLARRFGAPDLLEAEARENPLAIIHLLLKDLGPKTAAEIKDELSELVIPEEDWTKWWQGVRTKLKKDTMIDTPTSLKEPFVLRDTEVSHEERLLKAIQKLSTPTEILLTSYNYVRDLPAILKDPEVKKLLIEKLRGLKTNKETTEAQNLEIAIFLKAHFGLDSETPTPEKLICELNNISDIIDQMNIIAFKKKALMLVREERKDWEEIFLKLLEKIELSQLRDYILNELNTEKTRTVLISKIKELIDHPVKNPELFLWYFQKITSKHAEALPFDDKAGQCKALEAFLTLMHAIEHNPEHRDLVKKMYNLVTNQRYLLIRELIEDTNTDFLKEFLLLISKCHTLNDHDKKIMHSLVEVVNPTLSQKEKLKDDSHIVWTTQEGYNRTQERVRTIGTKEMVDNAREIETARAHGDLRENSEYKYALEKRTQLQSEMKRLSSQLNKARVITAEDISTTKVGIGNCVAVKDSKGHVITYTILGPWDANPDQNMLSFQSQLAQLMLGLKEGEKFSFKDEEFTIIGVKSYLDSEIK